MPVKIANLFADSAAPDAGERIDVLLQHRNLLIERIVSAAHLTPAQYLQSQDEWVVLLRGDAELDVAGEPVELKAGDCVFIPAATVHKVKRASQGALWLAVHLHPAEEP